MPYGNDGARLRALRANLGSSRLTGAPGTLHLALQRHATDPAGTLGVEPNSTGNYARVAFTNDDAAWTFGTVSAANAAEIRFPVASGVYSITDALNQWVLYDNAAGGTALAFGALTTTITVTGAGDVPVIPIGTLVITEGP